MLQDLRDNIWNMSGQVLRESALPNGAIVAANGIFLPPTATTYHFVWGRDAARQLLAAHALGIKDGPAIRARFLRWIVACMPGDETSKLLFKRNQINGPNDFLYNDDRGFQPDNNGALIAAIAATRGNNAALDNKVMRMLANGLAAKWDLNARRFTMRQQDLWENKTIEAGDTNFFTHALIVAAHGLSCAATSLRGIAPAQETAAWSEAASQMYAHIFSVGKKDKQTYFGKQLYPAAHTPNQLDACLALVLPELLPDDAPDHTKQLAAATIVKIGSELLWLPYGSRRYKGDLYDGIERYDGTQASGGAWPLLGYAWARMAYRTGRQKAALDAKNALDRHLQQLYAAGIVPKYCVPEQIFPDGDERNGKGPMHFGWGSAEWTLTEKFFRQQAGGK